MRARMHDYFLGGSHNFGVDRAAAREVIASWPDIVSTVQQNRAFQHRVVRHFVRSGIRQFLELGSGIPTAGSVHEVAQSLAPESVVAYVDIDPITVAHSAHILRDDQRTAVVHADIADTDAVFGADAIRDLFDLDQPVGILMLGILHFVTDDDRAFGAVAGAQERVAPNSELAIWHPGALQGKPYLAGAEPSIERLYGDAGFPFTLRSRDQVRQLFGDWDVLEPGLVKLPEWRPDSPGGSPELPGHTGGFAGVARKERR